MNQAAVASLAGILAIGIGGSIATVIYENGQIANVQANFKTDQAALAHDRSLLIHKDAIHAAYETAQKLHPLNDRREILSGIQKFPGVTLRGFVVGYSDNHFKVNISGPYTRLISVIVGFPATVPGVTIQQIQISVDHGTGSTANNAAAEITGTLS